jgi:hypothetical protein
MGIDRFVTWPKGKGHERPTLDMIRETLEDYLGGAMEKIDIVDGVRIVAVLKGRPSFPFRRQAGLPPGFREATEQHTERWIEVFWTKKDIDVITRQTDEYTNVVAEGFAALCARFWQGKRDA